MSKRFGRNQKRKLKTELSTVEAKYSRLEITISSKDRRLRDLERENRMLSDAVNLTRDVLGYHFASLPLHEQARISCHPSQRAVRAISTPRYDFVDFSMSKSIVDLTETIHELDVIYTRVELDELRGIMHYEAVTPCGEVRYAVSTQAIAFDGFKNYMTTKIASMLADSIQKLYQEKISSR